MPVKPTFPGVYIEEVPSGVRPVTGVATAIAAFVDRFERGPVDLPVQVFGWADVEREFGGLAADSPGSYALDQFFRNGGSEAHVVRVAAADARAAQVVLHAPPDNPPGAALLALTAGRWVRDRAYDAPGPAGEDLHVEVDYDTADPASLFNLTVIEIRTGADGLRQVGLTEVFRNLTAEPDKPASAADVVNEGSRLVHVKAGTAVRPDPTGTFGKAMSLDAVAPSAGTALTMKVGRDGGQPVTWTATMPAALPPNTTLAQVAPFLEAAIRGAQVADGDKNAPLAAPARALLQGVAVRPVRMDATNVALHVQGARGGAALATHDLTLTFEGAAANALGLAGGGEFVRVQQHRLSGGKAGGPVLAADLIGPPGTRSGLRALREVDLFTLLCVPRAAQLEEAGMQSVYAAATELCAERRAFLLIDVPEAVRDLPAMQDWTLKNAGLRHPNAAVYFPRVMVSDALAQGRLRSLGASGAVAGLYARTDGARGVWKAPAGTEAQLRSVPQLAAKLTDAEQGALNPLGINCLRNFPVFGPVAWGARTLAGADQMASDWKYVPVRRFALFLEESLYRGTQWVVFEPNDEPLWSQIRLNLDAFMHGLFRQGAFQSADPQRAYFVKCDRETTTQTDIDNGIVNIVVGFAPLKPAEFVIIRIQQIAGQTAA